MLEQTFDTGISCCKLTWPLLISIFPTIRGWNGWGKWFFCLAREKNSSRSITAHDKYVYPINTHFAVELINYAISMRSTRPRPRPFCWAALWHGVFFWTLSDMMAKMVFFLVNSQWRLSTNSMQFTMQIFARLYHFAVTISEEKIASFNWEIAKAWSLLKTMLIWMA